MKYSIHIDQKAIAENFPELDLKDAAILAFIKDFTHKRGIKKKLFNNLIYYWIAYSQVILDLPLLKIKDKRVIYRRFKKLAKCQIIEFHPDNQVTGQSYFCFGINYDVCIGGVSEKSEGYVSKDIGGVSEKSEGYVSKDIGGMSEKYNNYSIIDYSINYSIIDHKEEDFSKVENGNHISDLKDENVKEKSSAKKESTDWGKAQTVLKYLNTVTGSTYPILPNVARPIFAKIKGGATVQNMCNVIELKTHQWTSTKYEVNLTIKTLFGDKYWDYEQEVQRVQKNPSILKTKRNGKAKDSWEQQADVVGELLAELDKEHGK